MAVTGDMACTSSGDKLVCLGVTGAWTEAFGVEAAAGGTTVLDFGVSIETAAMLDLGVSTLSIASLRARGGRRSTLWAPVLLLLPPPPLLLLLLLFLAAETQDTNTRWK